jgi:hypothetical protein
MGSHQLLPLEVCALLGIALASFLRPRVGARGLGLALRTLRSLACRPARAIAAAALAAALLSAAIALLVHRPVPRVTDEFGYLLAADTFAHGRLANPPHPLWPHFESIHLLQQPTYASKFQPGQGLLLALGQALGGEPLLGVWIGAGLLVGSITWMLQAWLPARWAVLGGLLALAQFGVASYWTQSYWGGSLAACGGALVFGGFARLVRSGRARDAAVAGAGLVVLALTRPFEGALVALPAVLAIAAVSARRAGTLGARRALAPAAALLGVAGAGLAWLAYYDWRVTGDALLLPYRLHDATYEAASPFLWTRERTPPRRVDATLSDFYLRRQLEPFHEQRTWSGFWRGAADKARTQWRFYLGPFLSLPLVALPWVRRRGLRSVLVALALVGAGLLTETYDRPHYAAPATALVVLVVVLCMRRLAAWRPRGSRVGQSVVFGSLAVTVALAAAQALTRGCARAGDWSERRAEIVRQLEAQPGRQIVLVNYGPMHVSSDEWVYNPADLSSAKVLFARDLGEDANRQLLALERERTPWRLDVDHPGSVAMLRPQLPSR